MSKNSKNDEVSKNEMHQLIHDAPKWIRLRDGFVTRKTMQILDAIHALIEQSGKMGKPDTAPEGSESSRCEEMRCEALGDGECYRGHELGCCDAALEQGEPVEGKEGEATDEQE